MAQTRLPVTRGSLPWTGPRTGAAYGRPEIGSHYQGHYAEALSRRTPEERAAALEERLAELRAHPPTGYPTDHTA